MVRLPWRYTRHRRSISLPFPPSKSADVLLALCRKVRSMVLQILLVEDNAAQAYLVRHALERWKTPYKLHVVSSVEEALDFVNRRNGHDNAPQPHLTLLDLHLPNQPGFVVLEAIKNGPSFRNIAVVVMSTSVSHLDVQRAVASHANAYIQKPADWVGIERLFETLEAFWRCDARFAMKIPA